MLAELAELGMQLARATAAKALADLAAPEGLEEPEQQPASLATDAPPEAALAAPLRHASTRPAGARKLDPVTSFIRLATAVCQIIALEAGLAAGPATKGGMVSPALRADPRREPLLNAFREVTEHTRDRSAIRYEFARRLDEELTADPEQILGFPEIFYPLCMSLGIQLDVSKLSDEIIGMDDRVGTAGPIACDSKWARPIIPHATPPP
jgi:hypothetical protein